MASFAIAWQHPTEWDQWEVDPCYGSTAAAILCRPLEIRCVPMFIRQSAGWTARVWFDNRTQEVVMEVA
jgi:hypothetical protein